jgi:hypothetical protein
MTLGGKQIAVVVDQQTGIVTWYSDGEDTFTANVDWASPPAAGQTYTVEAPAGMKVKTVADQVVYAGSPAAAGRTAGFGPLVSDLAPDGYTLKAVATWKADPYYALQWVSDEVSNPPLAPPKAPLVAQLYTRGLSWFTMEQLGPEAMRSVGSGLRAGLDVAAGRKVSYQQATLQYGAFKGATAFTWYQESGPSLFVAGARRAVFVTGALTRQELIAFAEGLKPAPANTSR